RQRRQRGAAPRPGLARGVRGVGYRRAPGGHPTRAVRPRGRAAEDPGRRIADVPRRPPVDRRLISRPLRDLSARLLRDLSARPARDLVVHAVPVVAGALALALAFPRTDWAGAAWVALAPLVALALLRTPRAALGLGWL